MTTHRPLTSVLHAAELTAAGEGLKHCQTESRTNCCCSLHIHLQAVISQVTCGGRDTQAALHQNPQIKQEKTAHEHTESKKPLVSKERSSAQLILIFFNLTLEKLF